MQRRTARAEESAPIGKCVVFIASFFRKDTGEIAPTAYHLVATGRPDADYWSPERTIFM